MSSLNQKMEEMLKNVEWGEFKLEDLFESSNGNFDIKKEHINHKGDFVITSGLTNNGILGKTDIKAKIFDKKTITIDMFGYAFYRNFKYKMVTHARVFSLKPKFEITDNQGLFLSNSFHFLSHYFGYEKMCTWEKSKELKISLPTKNGKIDFDFMERFIEEIEKEKIKILEEYLEENDLKDCTLTSEEKQVLEDFENGNIQWGEFKLGDLFEIFTGRDVIIGNIIDGNIPLISHQHENNGITKKIKKLENRRIFNYKDTLSLADRGVFLATTQNENFHIGTRVKALKFKTGEKNIKTRLFFVSSINKLQALFFEYSKNATNNLPNLNIQLPVKNNNPDFEKMEILISAVEKLVVKKVVEYVEQKT